MPMSTNFLVYVSCLCKVALDLPQASYAIFKAEVSK